MIKRGSHRNLKGTKTIFRYRKGLATTIEKGNLQAKIKKIKKTPELRKILVE